MKGLFLAYNGALRCSRVHAATVHAADHCDGARTDAGQLRGRIGCKHTTAFDGTYTGVATQNISQGDTLDVARRKRPDNLSKL